jgi:hypothetical protein
MSREAHVRICGGLEVKFLRSTRRRSDDKGETQVEEPTRVRVPMRDTGTEQSVVAEKSRNGDGAKGLRCLPLFAGQPEMGGAS